VSLVVVVAVVLLAGVIWRARTTRRLTIEESVDRYRRTLSAVHEAAVRSTATDGEDGGPRRSDAPAFEPRRPRSRGMATSSSRRSLVMAVMAVATVVAVAVVVAASHGKGAGRASNATTTRPPATRPTSTTTRPAPTTTAPLLRATGTSGTSFTISKATYTLVVQTTTGMCWVDVRDPSGTALFSGTLAVGASQSITGHPVTVQLGNPAAVTVSIDGTPVPINLAKGSPVTLHFQSTPAAA
jgi:cytoskeletal protein RodZ